MSDQTILWRKLRTMPNTGTDADPDWRGTGLTPNSITALVGGTASNGTYSIRVRGKVLRPNGSALEFDETLSAVRSSETSAQMAGLLEDEADANDVLLSAGIVANVSSATITFTAPPGAEVTFSASAPGSATITFALGATLPISASSPNYSGSRYHLGSVIVQVNALDSSGVLLPPGTSTQTTFDMEIIEICAMKDSNGVLTYRYAKTATLADCNLATEYAFPIRGAGYWTVRLTGFADPVASTASYEVIFRDATS